MANLKFHKIKIWEIKDLDKGSAYETNEQRMCHRNGLVTETDGF